MAAMCRAQCPEGWYTMNPQSRLPLAVPTWPANQAQSESLPQLQTNNVPAYPIAETNSPQIQALADGLQDDPVRIFDYVHDHIKFVLYFGSKKGAELTLLERSGNDFDQCALLTALLRAAGYTNTVYRFGWMWLPYDDPLDLGYDLHHWWQLKLDNTNWMTTTNYLEDLVVDRGYPSWQFATNDLGVDFMLLQRMWVFLTIGPNTFSLDPAFKISEPVPSVLSLTNAMGGSGASISNALITAAGGTNTGNIAQNLNEAAVRSQLTGYTTNLLNDIQSNAPNASVQEVLGGWQITPANNSLDYSNVLAFATEDFGGAAPVLEWANEPTNMMSTLKITFAGTNYQWFIPELQGDRLSLTFDNGGTARLWQDDTLLAQNGTSGSNTRTNVILFVHHPVGGWNFTNNTYVDGTSADQATTNSYQRTNANYALIYAFEPDWGWLQQRQNVLDEYLQEGLTNGTRRVETETLNIMGLNWLLQYTQAGQMLAAQSDVLQQNYHIIGRMAQETNNGYYVDIGMILTGEYPDDGDGATQLRVASQHNHLESYFGSALEHGIIEQLQDTNILGASAVKMLEVANTNAQAVYLASSTNWTGGFDVSSHLTNYSLATKSQISNLVVHSSYAILLPKNGSNHVSSVTGSWAGYGYIELSTNNLGPGAIVGGTGGGYNGGISSLNVSPDPNAVQSSGDNQPTATQKTPATIYVKPTGDPVDTTDGTFQVEDMDMSLGQAEPRGITLSRYYNGTRRFVSTAGMTAGWTHNYSITANNVAAPQAGWGGTTPAQAAPLLTATAAALATYNGGAPNPQNWMTIVLISKWGTDQLTKNGVSVNLGKDTYQFIQQPDGTFTPPANCTATLTQNGSSYSLSQRHGNTFNFDSLGRLTNIVDQYSQSLKITYNSSNWVSTVTDWTNRTFTFAYSGTPSRLASVSDGTRTVKYGYSTAYNTNGDLTSFTDADGNTNTYVYDTNHQIIATLDALNRLVVTNVYDTQGHVTTQYIEGDTNKMWQIFWSGWQTTEFDPGGGRQDYLFDDQGRPVVQVDALGHETEMFYDGQNHVTDTVSALNETNQFVYDGNNNLIETIDPLGFSNVFVFDLQNNLIHTIDARQNTNSFGYNTKFSLIASTNGAGDWLTNNYDSTTGLLTSRTDAGGTTTFGYGSYGQLNLITYPGSLGSEGFLRSSLGDVLSQTNARGFITSFSYNSRRQLTNTVAPTNLTAKIAYDAVGNVATTTDARNLTSSNFWSATAKLLATTFPATPQGTPVVTNVYDSRDWLVKTLNPLQQPTTFTNDLAHRLIGLADALQRTNAFGYDADNRRTNAANAASETTRQQWSSRGELLIFTDQLSKPIGYGHDAGGDQVFLTNRNGKIWQFQYDKANRLTNTISPLGRTNVQAFNNRGLLQAITNSAGNATTFGYDARGRLTNRTDLVGSTTYIYDANGNLATNSENGDSLVRQFDAYDRLTSYTDANGNLIQYRYDANGNLTNLIYPGGRTVTYAYDSLNRVTNVTDWANGKTTITYDLANRLTSITRPNGTVRSNYYDAAGELTNIIEQAASRAPIAFFKLSFSTAARVQWEFGAPLPHAYTPAARAMTYDNDNRLATFNSLTVVHDLNGNMTSGPLTNDTLSTYSYDARNRLFSAGGLDYAYDLGNNRVAVTNGTNVAQFVISPMGSQVLMRIKGSLTNYYVYGAGLLYEVDETVASTNMVTYHFDVRGSTVALTDGSGNVTDRIEYLAYGMVTYRAGSTDTPFLFNGQFGVQTDANGLLYMRARYYNPYICRFINADPSGFSAGLNFYAYADGNPVSDTDPFGLEPNTVSTAEVPGTWNFGYRTLTPVPDPFQSLGPISQPTLEQLVDWIVNPPQPPQYYDYGTISAPDPNAMAVIDMNNLGSGSPYSQTSARFTANLIDGPLLGAILGPVAAETTAGDQTFQILDGVRRATAANLNGAATIQAEILDANMVSQGVQQVPINSLLSPYETISSEGSGLVRWNSVLNGTRSGATFPPITVTPGSSGIPIGSVRTP
jgi:RHS repeat-associated protein